jgi:hypothetical protein
LWTSVPYSYSFLYHQRLYTFSKWWESLNKTTFSRFLGAHAK